VTPVMEGRLSENTRRGSPRRGGLGRGLGALIPDVAEPFDAAGVMIVAIDTISPNPHQPRVQIDHTDLEALASSIRLHGVIQPIILARSDRPDRYTLVAGERRWRASRLAGLRSIPAVIMDVTPQGLLELALVENLIRSDLAPLEEAQAYRRLIEDFGLTQADVAQRVGRSRVSVTNTLRLLLAPDVVKDALQSGQISEGHARALLSLPSAADQIAMLELVVEKHLNVRETEATVRRWLASAESHVPSRRNLGKSKSDDDTTARLRRALATSVAIRRSGSGSGSIRIDFGSDEQLAEIVNRIAGEPAF
jgi:ParB family chromosome partitioning protein